MNQGQFLLRRKRGGSNRESDPLGGAIKEEQISQKAKTGMRAVSRLCGGGNKDLYTVTKTSMDMANEGGQDESAKGQCGRGGRKIWALTRKNGPKKSPKSEVKELTPRKGEKTRFSSNRRNEIILPRGAEKGSYSQKQQKEERRCR